jgi:DNA adenine methylase
LPNTLLNYFGGKGTLRNHIYPYFPEDYTCYIEPFGGAYSVGMKQQSPIEIYNDLDQNIYSLFKVLQSPFLFDEFKGKCDLTYYSDDIRKECVEKLKNPSISILERAYCFFITNRLSINGLGKTLSVTVWEVRRGMAKRVSDVLSIIDHLYDFHQRISRLTVLNEDGIHLIEKSDREDVFIYADPPYIWDTRSSNYRYPCDMDYTDQKRFIEAVLQLKKAKILISGYDNDLYTELEANGFHKAVAYVHPRRSQKEYLWFNYTPKAYAIDPNLPQPKFNIDNVDMVI